jgi:WD40 repeat protein
MRLVCVVMLLSYLPVRMLLGEDRPEIVLQTGSSSPASKLAFSPDRRLLVSIGTYAGSIEFWDWQTGRELRSIDLNVRGAEAAGATFVFAPDGRQIVVATPNRIWRIDVATGRQLQRAELPNDPSSVSFTKQLVLSADGKRLASMGLASMNNRDGNTVKIWDVWTAKEVATRSAPGINAIALSPDGKRLAMNGASPTSPSGLSSEATVSIWEVDTGLQLSKLTPPTEAGNLMSAPRGGTRELVFSPDGRYIELLIRGEAASQTDDLQRAIQARDSVSVTQTVLQGIAGIRKNSVTQVVAWETVTGRLALSWHGDDAGGHDTGALPIAIGASAFSRDGGILAAATGSSFLRVFDLKTSREVRSMTAGRRITSIALDSDGRTVAAADEQNSISVLEVATGRELGEFGGSVLPLVDLAMAANGRTLSLGGYKATATWDLGTGVARKGLSLPISYSHDRSSFGASREGGFFSPDGRMLAAGSITDASVKIWDTQTGLEFRTLPLAKSHQLLKGVFSPDGKLLAVAEGLGETQRDKQWVVQQQMQAWTAGNSDSKPPVLQNPGIRLIDTSTGLELRTLDKEKSSKDPCVIPFASLVGEAARTAYPGGGLMDFWGGLLNPNLTFSPDGKLLACGGPEGKIKLWAVATGQELRSIKSTVKDEGLLALTFSTDGRTLAAAIGASKAGKTGPVGVEAVTGLIKLFDVVTGKEMKTLVSGTVPRSLRYSPNGKLLAGAGMDATVRVWDMTTGQEEQLLKGHRAMVRAVAFSQDSRVLVSASEDGSARLWSTETGQELAMLVSLYGGEWIAVTPDGLFDGSPGAWNRILWRFSDNLFDVAPVEIFFNEFYYPGLVAEIASGGRPKATQTISEKDRRQPVLQIGVDQNSTGAARRGIVKVEVVEAPAGARDVRLFRNGSLAKVWHGDVLRGQKTVMLQAEIALVAGENRLTAYAFNHDNIKSLDATLVATGAESLRRKGVAHILAVGIDRYANPEFQLQYAVADATDFAAELQLRQQSLGTYEHVEVVPLLNENATKVRILETLAGLAKKAQPEDVVVIYFAGHGTARGDRFYLVPHDLGYQGGRTALDAAGLSAILEHSISDIELQQALEGLDVAQSLLIIDACNSGQALEAKEKRRGPMNSKGLAQLAYEKGLYLLTAAQGYQAALEAVQLGHGFLTYALVEEGLKQNAADFEPKDGAIVAREWLDYATERVPQMQADRMREGRTLVHEIAFVDGEEKIQDLEKRSVQQPRVFYRRELDQQPWIISKKP